MRVCVRVRACVSDVCGRENPEEVLVSACTSIVVRVHICGRVLVIVWTCHPNIDVFDANKHDKWNKTLIS